MDVPNNTMLPVLLDPSNTDFARLGGRELSTLERERVHQLHRRAPLLVEAARSHGIELTYAGVAPGFNDSRLYRGESDWVVSPIDDREPGVVPAEHLRDLRRLERVSEFSRLRGFIAHQVEPDRVPALLGDDAPPRAILTREQALALAGPTPPHAETVGLANRLEDRSMAILSGIRAGATFAGETLLKVLAAPLVIVEELASATQSIDPVILGALPVLREEVGEPMLFFVVARWDW